MIRTGSGYASWLTTSSSRRPPSPGTAAVSSSPHSWRILGASAAMTLGANASATSRRSRVWSGGSSDRNDRARCARSSGGASSDLFR